MDSLYCPHCKHRVTPLAPKTAWKIANVAFWGASLLVSTAVGSVIGLNIVLLPLVLIVGMAVGTSAARAAAWTCPQCHDEIAVPDEVAHAASARHGRLVTHHA